MPAENNVQSNDLEKKYIRKDVRGGYLFNESEIKYYNQIEQIDVYDNLLLGDWLKNGEYKIEEPIKNELVAIPKYYTSAFGDNMFCETYDAIAEFGKLEFSLKIENNKPENGYITATLNLLEDIDRANGYYQNTNTGFVDSYVAKDTPSFVADCFAKFNIYQKKEDGFLKKANSSIDLIVARKRELSELKQKLMPKLDVFFKKLVDKKMNALKNSQVGQKIIDEFYGKGATITGFFIKDGMPGYSRYLNQMLDSILDLHSEEILNNVKLKASLNEANNSFVNELNGEKTQIKEEKVIKQPKVEKEKEL